MAKNASKNFSDRFRELGLGTKRVSTDRFITKSGQFNVIRRGVGIKGFSLYHWLLTMNWFWFFVFVVVSYILVNVFFGLIYYWIGADQLSGFEHNYHPFLHCFYFSSQTLTTVGYGSISPIGSAASLAASIEAMVGLLGFAFATGLMYGRFSKAKSKILFSNHMLVSPYRGIKGLKFRIANARKSQLIEMEARVMYSFLQYENGETKRRYMQMELEIGFINMFPLPWTIVHPINEESPLFGKSAEDLKSEKAEFLIILKGYNDTFNQYVHQIHEYSCDEVVYDADFDPMFDPASVGETVVHLDKIDNYHRV